MIYKYVSSREVIDKFFGDTGYNEDVPLADVIRWISEALDRIAVKMQYIRKIAGDKSNPLLKIVNYKAQLPCDFFQLEQLAINGFPAKPSNNTLFHAMGTDYSSTESLMQEIAQTYQDNFGNEFIIQSYNDSKTASIGYEYDINNNYITTNVKDGDVFMSYLAYPVDEEGFPMIPDDTYYLEAVATYIRRMLDYRLWRGNPKDGGYKAIYDDSNREWLWYVGAAKAAGLRQDPSTMESLVNSFVSMIPKLPQHNRFYKF